MPQRSARHAAHVRPAGHRPGRHGPLPGAGGAGGLQAVLFDMDGLLVDSEPLWFEAERLVMSRLGGEWTAADQRALMGGSLQRTVSYLLARADRPAAGEQVAGWLLEAMTGLLESASLPMLPGAAELIAEVAAAGLPSALVTSSEREIMTLVLARTGARFDATVCAADVTRGKPDAEPYLLATALLGADPPRCVALEDSPNGVASAEAAGCPVVAVPSMVPLSPRPGRLVVGSLREISLPALRGLMPLPAS